MTNENKLNQIKLSITRLFFMTGTYFIFFLLYDLSGFNEINSILPIVISLLLSPYYLAEIVLINLVVCRKD